MRYLIFLLLCLFPTVALSAQPEIILPTKTTCFVGTVKYDNVSVRLLVLKHCYDSIADSDGSQAVQAANLAATEGLDIKDIGNYRINKNGRVDHKITAWYECSMADLKDFVSEQMKVQATSGDTFIIYTIGHGGGGGGLQNIGQRKILVEAFAKAAEENSQQTLWWQLSCHAAAGLPDIATLNEKQKELFSMLASSPADQVSYFNTQGAQMKKVFLALAQDSQSIDPNRDQIITAKEFADFLNTAVSPGRGNLLFASSPDKPIFGFNFISLFPIVDEDGREHVIKHHIPSP